MLLLWFLITPLLAKTVSETIHHNIQLTLEPASEGISASDTITLPTAQKSVGFLMHAALTPTLPEGSRARMAVLEQLQGIVPLRRYLIEFETPKEVFALDYRGRINHSLEQHGERASTRRSSPGLITPEGVFLAGSSFWYPVIGDHRVTFRMQVALPPGWQSVSQGEALEQSSGWSESRAQEQIYLIAAPFHRYANQAGDRLAEVYLRNQDPTLAQGYLDATQQYIRLYSSLLGDYPYTKFALVENFWESGYGMPSFTLLGPSVIRLPFIVHTSYPHEILHNWWGNGVYTDPSSGNWSEGLTTYLADHLLKEIRGQGAQYRRKTLQDYDSYVTRQDDFPLNTFRANHGQISQAVGYGKTLMLFHMLRNELGDDLFLEGLRHFYSTYRFKFAGYRELEQSFEQVSGMDLTAYFRQWLGRTGAPGLRLSQVETSQNGQAYQLSFELQQTQQESPFVLRIPLFLHVQGAQSAQLHWLEMNQRRQRFQIDTRQQPIHMSIDPRYDLFRHLSPEEIPSSLGQLFGAKQVMAILPANAEVDIKEAYRSLAEQWQQRQPGLRWLWDNEMELVEPGTTTWILGRENRFANRLQSELGSLTTTPDMGSYALTRRAGESTEALLHGESPQAIVGLARKLPHYGRYSYVLFQGSQPTIQKRGEWEVTTSPLSLTLHPAAKQGELQVPQRTPLASLP